jgi:hypothetical protein
MTFATCPHCGCEVQPASLARHEHSCYARPGVYDAVRAAMEHPDKPNTAISLDAYRAIASARGLAQIIAGGNEPSAEVVALLINAANDMIAMLRMELSYSQNEAKRISDQFTRLHDPFRVDNWPDEFNWRTVDGDGQIVYHKEMPTLMGGGMWFSDDMHTPGSMQMFGADCRNSLRARPSDD